MHGILVRRISTALSFLLISLGERGYCKIPKTRSMVLVQLSSVLSGVNNANSSISIEISVKKD